MDETTPACEPPELREVIHECANQLSSLATLIDLALLIEDRTKLTQVLSRAKASCDAFDLYLRGARQRAIDAEGE